MHIALPSTEHASITCAASAVRAVEVVQRQAELLEVVLAGRPGGGLVDLLDRREKPNEDGDDGDHH
jgi:hypothetical protein